MNQAEDRALAMLALNPAPYVGPAKRAGKNKQPTTPNGFKDYSNDPERVRELFEKYPGNAFGIWPGPSGLVIEDIDTGVESGFDTVLRLDDEWESTLHYDTPSGGQHHIWPAPDGPVPGPAAPIKGYPGIDRRSGDSLCLWYGDPVPTQEQWDAMRSQTVPRWILGPVKSTPEMRATNFDAANVDDAEESEVLTWIESLSQGEPIEDMLADTGHYGDTLDALMRLASAVAIQPNRAGYRATFDLLTEGYVNSAVSTTPDTERIGKILGMLKWILPRAAEGAQYADAVAALLDGQAKSALLKAEAEIARIEAELEPTSWTEQEFSDVLDGSYQEPVPTVLQREDGQFLFYPGLVNDLHGESESGKSWIAACAAVQEVSAGHHVRYIDFESNRATVVGRMLLLGADPAKLRKHFHYYRPDRDPQNGEDSAVVRDVQALIDSPSTLTVIDGVTEAMFLSGLDPMSIKDIPSFNRLPKSLALATGAAVVMIDHIAKGGDAGRFAFGSQHKMAAIDGASYLIDIEESIAPGKVGTLALKVAKDRNGNVRKIAGKFSAQNRLQTAALFELDSTVPGRSVARVLSWSDSKMLSIEATKLAAKRSRVSGVFAVQNSFASLTKFADAYGADYVERDVKPVIKGMVADGLIEESGGGAGKAWKLTWVGGVNRPGVSGDSIL